MEQENTNFNESINTIISSVVDKVVAVEPHENAGAELFIREKDSVYSNQINFSPFILIPDLKIMEEFTLKYSSFELKGEHKYKYLINFENLFSYKQAVNYLNRKKFNMSCRFFNDMQQQILIDTKIRLFRNMIFSDLRRMQFDIETLTTKGYDFTNPLRPDDKIVVISMSDTTNWEKCLLLKEGTNEKALLEEFVSIIKERDPDVIEGHNIFRFDLPFIEERARRHHVQLNIGRNNSIMTARNSRFNAAEKTIAYKKYEIYGRHIVDTWFMAQLYDISHRELESYGLKSLAIHFNVASDKRVYLDSGNIDYYYEKEKHNLTEYALDDVRETKAISEILSPSYFYQAQLQPFSYQNIIVRGNATKIDAMLVAEYITRKESIPVPDAARELAGALTDALSEGIFEDVWHCDIRSLYPSIIISEDICPRKDTQKFFYTTLKKLREIRLKAKDLEKNSQTLAEKNYFNSLQTTFKIMINSFYGYLAFSQGSFNDYSAAEHVTRRGREILTTMLNFLESAKAKLIEMDTDGIYFKPPEEITSTSELEKEIQKVLPSGIEVELDAVYRKMFCYKSKNYALLSNNGEISITGAALKSRGVEPFIREYIKSFIALLLQNDFITINELTEKYRKEISEHIIPLNKLAKTETLNDAPETYRAKLTKGTTKRSAVYELALSSNQSYRQGDQISYYVIGNKKSVSVVDNCKFLKDSNSRDENTLYYLKKLDDIYKKFIPYAK